MDDLSPRQIELLKAIILEYTEIGDAVGSDILDKKYKLGVSPATIRNDMVVLAKNGYLKKEYFSSGRVPTAKAFRFYIKNLMHEKELSTAEEVSYKSDVWDFRHEVHKLLQHSAKACPMALNFSQYDQPIEPSFSLSSPLSREKHIPHFDSKFQVAQNSHQKYSLPPRVQG